MEVQAQSNIINISIIFDKTNKTFILFNQLNNILIRTREITQNTKTMDEVIIEWMYLLDTNKELTKDNTSIDILFKMSDGSIREQKNLSIPKIREQEVG